MHKWGYRVMWITSRGRVNERIFNTEKEARDFGKKQKRNSNEYCVERFRRLYRIEKLIDALKRRFKICRRF